ncbi:hypothetical protein [Actibacterium sp. D379-3]
MGRNTTTDSAIKDATARAAVVKGVENGMDAAAAKGRKARIATRLGEAGSSKRQTRKQMVMKIYGLLTKTPADDSGMVADTPFSQTGVARLMETLQKRAESPEAPGAKVAAGMLKFLSPEDGSAETVSGASVEKLQWVAKKGSRLSK